MKVPSLALSALVCLHASHVASPLKSIQVEAFVPSRTFTTRSAHATDGRCACIHSSSPEHSSTSLSPVILSAAASTERDGQICTSPTMKSNRWRADYRTSMETQRRIKEAGEPENSNSRKNGSKGSKMKRGNRGGKQPSPLQPLQLAINVLDTFLSSPPEECNAANLVCSLTLSAKLVSRIHQNVATSRKNAKLMSKFRSLRDRTFVVLETLVKDDLMSPRQLCNSAWAVGKHFLFDNAILPGYGMGLEMGMRERWYLNDVDSHGDHRTKKAQINLSKTMDEIAIRLTNILDGYDGVGEIVVKVGELTMACWAFAHIRPRNIPPGWELPPRVGRVPGVVEKRQNGVTSSSILTTFTSSSTKEKVQRKGQEDVVVFERLDSVATSSSSSSAKLQGRRTQNDKFVKSQDKSKSDIIMDNLFDAVANTLCWESEHMDRLDADGNECHYYKGTKLLRQCPWKDLSTIVWSFATRGHYQSKSTELLMQAAVKEASRRLDAAPRGAGASVRFNSISNRKSQRERNNKINKKDRSDHFIPRDVAQLVWAVGVLQSDNYRLGNALVDLVDAINRHWIGLGVDLHYDEGRRPFENWQTADLVQLAVALSHGRIDDTSLLSEVYNEAMHIVRMGEETEREGGSIRPYKKKMRHWRSWELSIMLWVQANLYLKQGQVFLDFAEAVPRAILNKMERMKANGSEIATIDGIGLGPQEQANVAWSLTILEEYRSEKSKKLLEYIFKSAFDSFRSGAFIRLENAHQLWQAYFLLENDCPEVLVDTNTSFREYLERTWNAEKSREKISSARHRSISQTLDLMGVAHENEHDEDIDVAIILSTQSSWTHTADKGSSKEEPHHKVAVEFDGPKHFTRINGGKPRALGHTVLKYRILKQQGWTVVRVPFYEFDKIPFWASMERQRYLQRLLKTHADIRFSEVDVSEYKPLVSSRQTRFD